eukprot:45599_1
MFAGNQSTTSNSIRHYYSKLKRKLRNQSGRGYMILLWILFVTFLCLTGSVMGEIIDDVRTKRRLKQISNDAGFYHFTPSAIKITSEMREWEIAHEALAKRIHIESTNDRAWIVPHDHSNDIHVSGEFARGRWWDEEGLIQMVTHIEMIMKRYQIEPEQQNGHDKLGILDIGANIGSYTVGLGVHFAKRHPEINIFAFEPLWQNYVLLMSSINKNQLNNVYLYPYGLTEDGQLGDTVSFVIDKVNKGHSHIDSNDSWSEVDGETVSIDAVSIDNLEAHIPLESWRNILWTKLDTEGLEFSVLKGAVKFLKNHGPCYIKTEIIAWSETKMALLKFMDGMNYATYLEKDFDWNSVQQNKKKELSFRVDLPKETVEVIFVKNNIRQCVAQKIAVAYPQD